MLLKQLATAWKHQQQLYHGIRTQLPSIGQFHVGFAESYTKLSTLNCQDSWSKVYSFATNPTRICTVSFSNLAPIQADPTPDCPLLEVWSDNFANSIHSNKRNCPLSNGSYTDPTQGSYRFERILHGSYRSPAVHGCESYPDSYSSGATPTPIPTVDFAGPILRIVQLVYSTPMHS